MAKFETEFNINDGGYCIIDGSIEYIRVCGIKISVDKYSSKSIHYVVETQRSASGNPTYEVWWGRVFKTREELIDNLINKK